MKRVLIVDDAAVIRLMIRGILEYNGFEIVGEAKNGKEAVSLYKELKPDVVTLDIIMPEMDGVKALKEILEFDSSAKVIMVTAIDQRAKLMEAIRLGASDYIVKPFEEDRVLSAVKKTLKME
jgi:two-component system chemotaxis response regulator CheY